MMCFCCPLYEGWVARGFRPFDRQSPQCPRLHPHQLPRGRTSWRPNQDVTSAGCSSAGLQPRPANSRPEPPAQPRSASPAASIAGGSAPPPGASALLSASSRHLWGRGQPTEGTIPLPSGRLGPTAVQKAALDQLASSGRPTFRTPLLPLRATANSGSSLWASLSRPASWKVPQLLVHKPAPYTDNKERPTER